MAEFDAFKLILRIKFNKKYRNDNCNVHIRRYSTNVQQSFILAKTVRVNVSRAFVLQLSFSICRGIALHRQEEQYRKLFDSLMTSSLKIAQ